MPVASRIRPSFLTQNRSINYFVLYDVVLSYSYLKNILELGILNKDKVF
ncbi:hypothetical protein LEP1GSC046_1451 [Leptospira kirschneri serovar Bim str. 1051]|nr:hypothetical protein LEP1GSC042_2563 [Leptospira kirschneri serovar Bim str. PUO 1247]EMN03726.1 hypothetical protein LEP1GSC046_1451 [Leptospira kirschneri serovar Bim str. 1051]